MNEQNSLFRTIIDNIGDGVYFVDLNRRIQLWNGAANHITGYEESEVVGRCCQDNLLNHVDHSGKPLCQLGCPLYASMNDGQPRQAEVLLRHKNGYRLPVTVHTHPVFSGGEIVGALEIFSRQSGVNYDDHLVESLTDKAMKDPLTGLANRAYLESYLGYKLSEAARFQSPFSVLSAEVDDFADFTHHYGHAVGDALLQSMAESFRHFFTGPNLVGMWSQGVFVGVFQYSSQQDVQQTAQNFCVLAMNSSLYHAGAYLGLTASVGMTLSQPWDTVQSICARAEGLMHQSRLRGKNSATVDVAATTF